MHEWRELRALRNNLNDGEILVLLRLEDINLGRAAAARNSRSRVITAGAGASTGRTNLRNEKQGASGIRTTPAGHSANSIQSCSQSATCPSEARPQDRSHPCTFDWGTSRHRMSRIWRRTRCQQLAARQNDVITHVYGHIPSVD